MHIFRWIIGIIAGLLAAGSVVSLVIFLLMDIGVWLDRARALRRLTFAAALLWFNVEVWGSVLYTILHWRG